jgi:hypothetical protein
MIDLKIKETQSSPKIDFNIKTGVFNISGRSIIEDPTTFYSRLYEYLIEYFSAPAKKTEFHIRLEYMNSSSSKYMTGLFRILEDQHRNKGKKIEVHWYYEKIDESIMEIGQHYKTNIKLPFYLIECSDFNNTEVT